MEKIYHRITEFTKNDTPDTLIGEFCDLFEPIDITNRKVFLIFDTKKIHYSFLKMINGYSPNNNTWLVIKKPQPCQVLDIICYRLPNGIEVSTHTLNI